MNSILKRIGVCILILLLFGGAVSVTAEEVEIKQLVPMFLSGTLYIGDEPAPPGTVVYADLLGYDAGSAETMSEGVYGDSAKPMMVQAGPNEELKGEPVTFWINGVQAQETILYDPGVNLDLDLHVTGAAEKKLYVIPQGGDVFIGEEGLDVSLYLNAGDTIAWFDPSSEAYLTEPVGSIVIDNPKKFFIDPAQFMNRTGRWWIWSGDKSKELAFIVKDPSIALRIWNQNEDQDINDDGAKIPAGNIVNFRIETNLYSAILQRGAGLSIEELGIINMVGSSNVTKVNYQSLRGLKDGVPDVDISLRNLATDANPWYWPENNKQNSGWDTGALGSDLARLYPNGEYNFYAEVTLNNIRKNYPGDQTGKAITRSIPAFIVDDEISVVINPASLTRKDSFFVTVGGRPGKDYIIVIMECAAGATDPRDCCALKMSGAPCERPPMIRADQTGVAEGNIVFDTPTGPFTIGDMQLSPDCCEMLHTVRDMVPTDDKPNARSVYENGVYYYAQIRTDGDNEPTPGFRTVEFSVGPDVMPNRPYRIHVQSIDSDISKVIGGDALVQVNEGVVTFDVRSEPPYYLGNDIILSGTNTDGDKTYLFMTGSQCQNKCGNDLLGLKRADPSENIIMPGLDMINLGCVEEANQFTAIEVPVKSDGTWEYVWKTSKAPINPGTYTVYASSQPINGCCLDCACAVWAARDIILEEPCFDVILEPNVIEMPFSCCPDGCSWNSMEKIMLTGVACGFPHTGQGWNVTKEINMWIFGVDKVGNQKYINARIPVFSDDTFEVNLVNYLNLCEMKPGDYTIILQHPMYNHQFDMVDERDVRDPIESNRIWMVSSYPDEWSKLFPLDGPGYYQGSKAVTAIKDFLDQRLVDDKYIMLTLTIVDDRVPTAAFSGTPTQGNRPLEVAFKDESKGKDLTQRYWEFGDGTTSTELNPKKSYSEVGKYTVSLTVMNKDGAKDTTTKPDYINVREPRITADFTANPTTGAAPLNVQFHDRSTGSPTNWFWDFGDGQTAAGVKDPSHVYQYGGKYSVTLTVTLGDELDRVTKSDFITVIGGPQPTPTIGPYDPTKIQLYSGWNFISVARALADGANEASAIFRDVPTGGHAIWAYDPYKQFWDQVLTNTRIEPLNGYWIYSVTPYTVNLTFKHDPVSAPPSRNLPIGWAAIGFTGGNPATAKDTLKSVKDGWIYARGYDARNQQWESTIVNGGQGENTYLFPSKGYWLYMEKPGTLAAIGV